MRIAILSREFPPHTHVGGIATYSATIAKLLVDHGHEVHTICNGPDNLVEKLHGVIVHQVKMLPHPLPTSKKFFHYRRLFRKYLPNYLEAITWANTAANYMETHLDLSTFDVLEYPETAGEGALLARTREERPFVVAKIHTSWMNDYTTNWLEKKLLLRLQAKSCKMADSVVSPSTYMVEKYARKILKLKQSVQVCRNPIFFWKRPVDWQAKNPRHFLFVGRIEHRKGIQTLLNALSDLKGDADGITLRVVGHKYPPCRELDLRCQSDFEACLAKQLSLAVMEKPGWKMEYWGPSSQAEMAQHYDWAGVLIIPSLMENYPYVALEGLSRGCFLIGSAVGGIPEIINKPSRGLLFEPENSTLLAEKIREYIETEIKITEGMPTVVSEIEAEFNSEKTYQDLLETYHGAFTKPLQKKRLRKP